MPGLHVYWYFSKIIFTSSFFFLSTPQKYPCLHVNPLNKQELPQKTCKVLTRPVGGDNRNAKRYRQTSVVTLNRDRKKKNKCWGGRRVQNRKCKFCYMKYADILGNSIPIEKTIVKLGKLIVSLLLLMLLLVPLLLLPPLPLPLLLLPTLCISAGVFPCH